MLFNAMSFSKQILLPIANTIFYGIIWLVVVGSVIGISFEVFNISTFMNNTSGDLGPIIAYIFIFLFLTSHFTVSVINGYVTTTNGKIPCSSTTCKIGLTVELFISILFLSITIHKII